MSDVMNGIEAYPPLPATRVARAQAPASAQPAQAAVSDRRRPGRNDNVSPELIALMRKPTPEAIEQIALYDAPNFVLPDPTKDGTQISLRKLSHFAMAFAVCAAGWVAAFKLMMYTWG